MYITVKGVGGTGKGGGSWAVTGLRPALKIRPHNLYN